MATLNKSLITSLITMKMKSKIEILHIADTAKRKPQQGQIMSVGPLPLSTAHPN